LIPKPIMLRDARVRVFSNMRVCVLGDWWADRSHVCVLCLACFLLANSLGCLVDREAKGGDRSLGLQFGEI
jgi:hypothetical protein